MTVIVSCRREPVSCANQVNQVTGHPFSVVALAQQADQPSNEALIPSEPEALLDRILWLHSPRANMLSYPPFNWVRTDHEFRSAWRSAPRFIACHSAVRIVRT
jgi:hypothetical protein